MANQYYMSYDELYPERSQFSSMFPTYNVPVPRDHYKHHYGLKAKKGTHSFNDLNQVSDYIPPHYMKYHDHYGVKEHDHQHSFATGDFSDFGAFRNDIDAHSYLWGPGEYHEPSRATYDAHEFLDEDLSHPYQAPVFVPQHPVHVQDKIDGKDDKEEPVEHKKKKDKSKKEKKHKAPKHKHLDVSIYGDDPTEDVDISMDSLIHSIDVEIGHEL